MKVKYDFIVIGSGSAGSVIAARLAEDPTVSVLLLEAGPKDNHLYIRMPAALGFPLMNDRFNWFYDSEPEPHLNNRTIHEARGRVLGGSSSINGMNWVRANPWDYDNWAEMGLDGWSYADVLPYFKKAETFDRGPSTYRGGQGPMQVETCGARNPLYRAFLNAGKQMGLDHVEDHNGYKQEGVHITQRNVGKGIRFNTHYAYVLNQPPKANLHVQTDARVQRIETSNNRAVRIIAKAPCGEVTYEIEREAILCAGAINSPQLLQLSGIRRCRTSEIRRRAGRQPPACGGSRHERSCRGPGNVSGDQECLGGKGTVTAWQGQAWPGMASLQERARGHQFL